MCGAIPLVRHASSRCGAESSTGQFFMAWYLIKRRDNFIFTFIRLEGNILRQHATMHWISFLL
jgi:hypothetical protein